MKSVAVLALLVVILLWLTCFWAVPKVYGPPTDAGDFGSMFGVVESLFSGLAFVGVVLAILLQSRELALQRQELTATREELHGQREQLKAQSDTLRKQNFENTFFQLLGALGGIVSSMEIRKASPPSVISGRDCFRQYYEYLKALFENQTRQEPSLPMELAIERAYLKFYEGHQNKLGHYFRTIYNILKFIANSEVEDKKFYCNLLRAQLSSNEHLVLFYNCLSSLGREKAKPLIEKFGMLDGLPEARLVDIQHKILYSREAFGSSSI